MTEEPGTLDELLNARERLIAHVQNAFTDEDRKFLLSMKSRNPDWSLLDLDRIKDLPAVKWKLLNLNRMDNEKHEESLRRLEKILEETKR